VNDTLVALKNYLAHCLVLEDVLDDLKEGCVDKNP
jgi:hypothetical protein